MGTELNGTSEESYYSEIQFEICSKRSDIKRKTTELLTRTVTVSFREVYKIVVRDLLRTSDAVETSQGLPVREDSNGTVYVKDLTWCRVTNPKEMLTCLQQYTWCSSANTNA